MSIRPSGASEPQDKEVRFALAFAYQDTIELALNIAAHKRQESSEARAALLAFVEVVRKRAREIGVEAELAAMAVARRQQ